MSTLRSLLVGGLTLTAATAQAQTSVPDAQTCKSFFAGHSEQDGVYAMVWMDGFGWGTGNRTRPASDQEAQAEFQSFKAFCAGHADEPLLTAHAQWLSKN